MSRQRRGLKDGIGYRVNDIIGRENIGPVPAPFMRTFGMAGTFHMQVLDNWCARRLMIFCNFWLITSFYEVCRSFVFICFCRTFVFCSTLCEPFEIGEILSVGGQWINRSTKSLNYDTTASSNTQTADWQIRTNNQGSKQVGRASWENSHFPCSEPHSRFFSALLPYNLAFIIFCLRQIVSGDYS